jgi:hypothetical protein
MPNATLDTRTIYKVVLDANFEQQIYYRLTMIGENAKYEFNVGPRIGFKPFLIHEEDAHQWWISNEMFKKAEAQVGPCDVIFSHYMDVPYVTI